MEFIIYYKTETRVPLSEREANLKAKPFNISSHHIRPGFRNVVTFSELRSVRIYITFPEHPAPPPPSPKRLHILEVTAIKPFIQIAVYVNVKKECS
jgi:hypothetical protein